MRISDLMTTDVKCCRADDSLSHAAQIMWDSDCGCVPVVDGDGRLTAMVTDRDLCMAAYTQGLPLSSIPVATAASRRIYCVHEGDRLEQAENLMAQHQIRRVPVVDHAGRVTGIVSIGDIIRNIDRLPGLSEHDVAHTLAAVCTPAPKWLAAE